MSEYPRFKTKIIEKFSRISSVNQGLFGRVGESLEKNAKEIEKIYKKKTRVDDKNNSGFKEWRK